MAPSTEQLRDSNTVQNKESSQVGPHDSLPKTPTPKKDSGIAVQKSAEGKISITAGGARVGFKYTQTAPNGNLCSGSIQPLNPGDVGIKAIGIAEITQRQGTDILDIEVINADKLSAVVHKDGKVIEVPLLENNSKDSNQLSMPSLGLKSSDAKTLPNLLAMNKVPSEQKNSSTKTARNSVDANTKSIDTKLRPTIINPSLATQEQHTGEKKTDKPVATTPNKLGSLEEQAKHLGFPKEIANKAEELGIKDLGKVKIEGDLYVHCDGDICTNLGKVPSTQKQDSETKSAKPAKTLRNNKETKERESQDKTKASHPEIDAGLDLNKIPAGSPLKYTYQLDGKNASGTIDIPAINSRTSGMTMPGLGKFAKNKDGTFSFEAEKGFSGKIELRDASKDLKGSGTTQSSRQAQDKRFTPKPKRPLLNAVGDAAKRVRNAAANAVDSRSNVKHVTAREAMNYVRGNSSQNVVVVVTSPAVCPPCRTYDAALPGITNNVTGATFLIVNNGTSFSEPTFGITSVPTTMVFSKGRKSGETRSATITGVTNATAIKNALSR